MRVSDGDTNANTNADSYGNSRTADAYPDACTNPGQHYDYSRARQ
jgi:hypothetical protein